jgi:Helicase HerA, central domain
MPLTMLKPEQKPLLKAAPIPIMDVGFSLHTDELTGRVKKKPFLLDTREFLKPGERDAILASSGMGKSYLTGILLEEILEKSQQVVLIFDFEPEWHTLKSRYDNDKRSFKVIGSKESPWPAALAIPVTADQKQIQDCLNTFELAMAPFIQGLIRLGISCVFDLSSFSDRDKQGMTAVLCELIFRGEYNLQDQDDEPHNECRKVRVAVDEAHLVAPQQPEKLQHNSLEAILKIAKRGRKRNIHLLLATQTPASLNKEALKQCNRHWLGGITSHLDYKPNKSIYLAAGLTLDAVQKLEPGTFVYASGLTRITIVGRIRHCKHGGETKKESTRPIASKSEADALLKEFL